MERRHRGGHVSPFRSRRALSSLGLLALLGAACGQIGGVHQQPVVPAAAVVNAAAGPEGLADNGVNVGDTGGVRGPSISGDSSVLGEATKITKTVTVTQTGPALPPF